MKMMKKVASLVLAGAMVLSMSVAAFAAGISADEQKILDQAAVKAAELGVSTDSPEYQKYYSQAVTYVQTHEMDEAAVNGALETMDKAADEAKKAMTEAGVTSIFDLEPSKLTALRNTCTDVVNTGLKEAGIKVYIGKDGSVEVKDPAGPVFGTKPVIKQTGSDLSATAGVAVLVVGAIAACGVVAKKKELFARAEA